MVNWTSGGRQIQGTTQPYQWSLALHQQTSRKMKINLFVSFLSHRSIDWFGQKSQWMCDIVTDKNILLLLIYRAKVLGISCDESNKMTLVMLTTTKCIYVFIYLGYCLFLFLPPGFSWSTFKLEKLNDIIKKENRICCGWTRVCSGTNQNPNSSGYIMSVTRQRWVCFACCLLWDPAWPRQVIRPWPSSSPLLPSFILTSHSLFFQLGPET